MSDNISTCTATSKSKCIDCKPPVRHPGCQDHCPHFAMIREASNKEKEAREREKLFHRSYVTQTAVTTSYKKLRRRCSAYIT